MFLLQIGMTHDERQLFIGSQHFSHSPDYQRSGLGFAEQCRDIIDRLSPSGKQDALNNLDASIALLKQDGREDEIPSEDVEAVRQALRSALSDAHPD